MIYSGQFAAKDIADHTIFITIVDASSAGTGLLVFASDPAILTHENVSLTDTIHSSQLIINLIATSDGQYRDLIEASGTVYCILSIDNSAVFWSGVLASRTWSEPFSREKNYMVSLTFSDFGVLRRMKYTPSFLAEFNPGAYKIDDLLNAICVKAIGYSPVINYVGLDDMAVLLTAFEDLYVTTRNFVDDDGAGLSLYDCLEKILAPAGAHIMQRCGKIYVFIPNAATYSSISSDVLSSLSAFGTDAELESCELFKDVTLTYNQTASTLIGEHRLDAETTGYEGKWDYVVDEEEGSYIIAGPRVDDASIGSCANFIKGSSVTPCIWYVDRNALHDPGGGVRNPSIATEISGTVPLADTQCEGPISAYSSRSGYPQSKTFLTIKVPVLFLYYPSGGVKIKDLLLTAQVKLTAHDGDTVRYYYSSDSGYGTSTDPSSRVELHYEDRGEEWGEDDVVWRNLVVELPAANISGVLEVTVYPNSIRADVRYGYIKIFAVQGVRVEVPESLTDLQIGDRTVIRESFSSESDDFEKEFDMGTPVLLSAGTFNSYMNTSFRSGVQDEDTYLRKYMDFLRQNYSLNVASRRRWHIRGSYRYDHSVGLAIFDASSQPLATIDDTEHAFLVTGEEWHMRSGTSILDLEEFYIGNDK